MSTSDCVLISRNWHKDRTFKRFKTHVTDGAFCGGVERWVSRERWCHADAHPHQCIGKVTSTSTVKMAHWWAGGGGVGVREGDPVYKGEDLPHTKGWPTTLTSLLHRYNTFSTKSSTLWIFSSVHTEGKQGKGEIAVQHKCFCRR